MGATFLGVALLAGITMGSIGWACMEHAEGEGAPVTAGTALWLVGVGTVTALIVALVVPYVVDGLDVLERLFG